MNFHRLGTVTIVKEEFLTGMQVLFGVQSNSMNTVDETNFASQSLSLRAKRWTRTREGDYVLRPRIGDVYFA
jgi:hypothetical protein